MQKIAKKHKNMYLCCAIRRKHIIMTYQETITHLYSAVWAEAYKEDLPTTHALDQHFG